MIHLWTTLQLSLGANPKSLKVGKVTVNKSDNAEGSDPCWKNYEMVGTKKKGGKTVPNCVPKTSNHAEIAVPEGWSVNRKPHRQGQHDKSALLDGEINPSEEDENG